MLNLPDIQLEFELKFSKTQIKVMFFFIFKINWLLMNKRVKLLEYNFTIKNWVSI